MWYPNIKLDHHSRTWSYLNMCMSSFKRSNISSEYLLEIIVKT